MRLRFFYDDSFDDGWIWVGLVSLGGVASKWGQRPKVAARITHWKFCLISDNGCPTHGLSARLGSR